MTIQNGRRDAMWLAREVSGWRRMAAVASDEAWRAACAEQAVEAEHYANAIGGCESQIAAVGLPVERGHHSREAAQMPDSGDVVTPEDDAYATYEALIDPRDEAELLEQEAEGQPVGDVWRERQEELRELLAGMGLGDQVAELEAEP